MVTISKAALPPIQPHISEADRNNPLFPQYQLYRSAMNVLLVEAMSFASWRSAGEREARDRAIMAHPKFKEWQAWMQANRAGARPCRPSKEYPKGVAFPETFYAWLEGERW
jgi:hypothetical protein